ncbi:MAG: metallophosphoesterase [Myxococcales bacterium]|nr:metallophosphoesterase [Myxococcales bacterium]
MPLCIASPELVGVTESSLTLAFSVDDASGPVDSTASVRLNGELRVRSEGPAGTRLLRVDGLEPNTEYAIEIQAPGAPAPEPDAFFPGTARTLSAPRGRQVASFATLNDLHFGEPSFGGFLEPDGERGEDRPGWGAVCAEDTDVPYWRFMNEDAIADINGTGVDCSIIKGDIADRGLPEQFESAARAFSGFSMPHHAFLGNHDYYGLNEGLEVDGYALLGQPPAPRIVDLGGWRLLLLETMEPGEHHGVFGDDRLAWLDGTLGQSDAPTLLLMHHHPVPPEHADRFPNTIGIRPEHSMRMIDVVGGYPQVRGVLIGHTHRNVVRRYPGSGRVPWIEVHCSKDYPGGFAHYRLFEDGSFRQEARRTSSPRALAHSTRCRDLFQGGYRHFACGRLEARSFESEAAGTRPA